MQSPGRAIALSNRVLWMGLVLVAVLAIDSGLISRAWLTNRASSGVVAAALGKGNALSTSLLAFLEEGTDYEPALRWLIIYQTVRGEFPAVKHSLQQYVTRATPPQIEQMEYWITGWSLRLAKQGAQVQAEQTMYLLSAFGDEAKACAGLGRLYNTLGRTAEAERFLRESLVLAPTASEFMELGDLYAKEGIPLMQTDYHTAMYLLDQAAQAFESAARIDDAVSVEVHYRLGDIYWKLSRRQDAVQAYQQAAEDGGRGYLAFLSWYYLGQIYGAWWNNGLDYDLARGYFERALEIAATRHDEAMSLSGIAATYAAQGRESEALVTYRRALRRDPTYEPAQRAIDDLEKE